MSTSNQYIYCLFTGIGQTRQHTVISARAPSGGPVAAKKSSNPDLGLGAGKLHRPRGEQRATGVLSRKRRQLVKIKHNCLRMLEFETYETSCYSAI